MFGEVNGIALSEVSCTMVLLLYGRAKESLSKDPILKDPMGEKFAVRFVYARVHETVSRLRGSEPWMWS